MKGTVIIITVTSYCKWLAVCCQSYVDAGQGLAHVASTIVATMLKLTIFLSGKLQLLTIVVAEALNSAQRQTSLFISDDHLNIHPHGNVPCFEDKVSDIMPFASCCAKVLAKEIDMPAM